MNNSEVQRCLRRLGGIYRDPTRVSRDASTLLNSDVGRHLRPEASDFVQNDGSSKPALLLKGTIGMLYKGQTYNIPIDVYLPPAYPVSPPVCFVRPVSSMMIKEGHRHVGRDGMVYMPYLHSWSNNAHNLVDACRHMSSIFGKEPPVFAKPPGYVAPAPAPTPVVAPTPTPPRYEDIATSSNNSSSYSNPISDAFSRFSTTFSASPIQNNQNNQMMEQERLAKLEAEVEESNAAVAVARAAEAKEERERALTKETREQVARKSTAILEVYHKSTGDEMSELVKDQIMLEKSRDFASGQIEYLTGRKDELVKCHEELDKGIAKLTAFVQTAEEEKSSSKEVSADELAVPEDIHSGQMLILSAENAALNDVLYFLDKALEEDRLSLDVHLLQYRKLTKRQFLVRAHLLKIAQVKASESVRQHVW
jgi:ESCRT-I complex subunit TSG101